MPQKTGWVRRLLLAALAAWLLLIAWGFLFSWRRLPEYPIARPVELAAPILSRSEYGALAGDHERPYVVEISAAEGALLLYGAEHTRDPDDPQIADIRRRWDAFRPTVALCESRLGILFPGLMDPVATFGEPGLVHELARDAGIPTYTWEPPLATKMESLLAQPFSKEQVALRVVLGPYFSNRRFGRPADPEAFVGDTFHERSNRPGIEGALRTLADLDAAWARHFPAGSDWRDVSDQYGLPGFLAEIDTNRSRDEHFAQVLVDLVRKKERVFAVAGSSHAVKLEPALRSTLDPR